MDTSCVTKVLQERAESDRGAQSDAVEVRSRRHSGPITFLRPTCLNAAASSGAPGVTDVKTASVPTVVTTQ